MRGRGSEERGVRRRSGGPRYVITGPLTASITGRPPPARCQLKLIYHQVGFSFKITFHFPEPGNSLVVLCCTVSVTANPLGRLIYINALGSKQIFG